jgi:hypothetical protein
MIIWRGAGIAIPIFAAVVAGILSFFFDDLRLGNLTYIGWILIITAAPTTVLALVALGGKERGSWARHTLFFIPAPLWVLILAGVGVLMVMLHNPASNQVLGEWEFDSCVSRCKPSLARSLRGMRITIDEEAITVGKKRRAYEVAWVNGAHLSLRYKDNGEQERMIMLGEDRFLGRITSPADKKGVSVRFNRVKN